jgi:prophage maintenance system killer protein
MRSCPASILHRLELNAIEASLRQAQAHFPRINEQLASPRDPLSAEVIDNMLAGYRCVDEALALDIDLFMLGNSPRILELNTLALCGEDPVRRKHYAAHIEASKQHFYQSEGIGDLMEWLERNKNDSVWMRAAGVYIHIVSRPQLFIEGNHRTGILLVSYMLAREGHPPFVLSVDNARAYFQPSLHICNHSRHSIAMFLHWPRLKRDIAQLLQAQSNPAFLLESVPGD